jgi:hypothetical protein
MQQAVNGGASFSRYRVLDSDELVQAERKRQLQRQLAEELRVQQEEKARAYRYALPSRTVAV